MGKRPPSLAVGITICHALVIACDELGPDPECISVPISIYVTATVDPITIKSAKDIFARESKHCSWTDLQTLQDSLLVAVFLLQRQLGELQFHDLTGLNGLSLLVIVLQSTQQ